MESAAHEVSTATSGGDATRKTSTLIWVRRSLALLLSVVLLPIGALYGIIYQLAVGYFAIQNVVLLLVGIVTISLLKGKLDNRSVGHRHPSLLLLTALVGWSVGTYGIAAYFFGGPVSFISSTALWWLSTIWIFASAWYSCLPADTRLKWVAVALAVSPLFALLIHVGEVRGDGYLKLEWRWQYVAPVAVVPSLGKPAESPPGLPYPTIDYPGFLGRDRTGVISNFSLNPDWVREPPTLAWRQPVGAAWSGIAIEQGIAVTQEQQGEWEGVVAFDAWTGERLWTHKDKSFFDGNAAGAGPRATPACSDGRVFSVGASGILNVLDIKTGKRIWSRDLLETYQASRPEHGVSGSPLVVGDIVIVALPCEGGPSLAAYQTSDGTPRWSAGKRGASYSSPMISNLNGTLQVFLFDSGGLISVEPSSGKILGSLDWGMDGNRCPQPVFAQDSTGDVFLTSYECGGAARFHLTRTGSSPWSAHEVWTSPIMKTKFTTPILLDDAVLGIDRGMLVSLDAKSGKRNWKSGRFGECQMILIGKHIVLLSEEGDLVLIEPAKEEMRELGRMRALDGKTWNTFALAYGRLYLRNAVEVICYTVAGSPTASADQTPKR